MSRHLFAGVIRHLPSVSAAGQLPAEGAIQPLFRPTRLLIRRQRARREIA